MEIERLAQRPAAPDFPLKLGTVSFLNMLPFEQDLRSCAPNWTILPARPAKLLGYVEQGACDAAMTPAFDYLSNRARLKKLARTCISSHGPAGSVFIFSKKPLRDAKEIELDRNSHTSNALARLLLRGPLQCPGIRFRTETTDEAETCVRIGDRAIRLAKSYPVVVDLGQAWLEWQGLPFVYAVWSTRGEKPWAQVDDFLAEMLNWNIGRLPQILEEKKQKEPGFDAEHAQHYLTRMLLYEWSEAHEKSLNRFASLLGY